MGIGDFRTQDIRKQIGNVLFLYARTIEMDELARRIHSSEGELDLDDELFSGMMLLLLEGMVYYRVRKAIEKYAVSVEGKEDARCK